MSLRRWVGLGVLFTVACATSPTGRRQLTLMSDSKMNAMGSESFDEMKKKVPVEKDPKVNEYVRCIAIPISKEATDKTGVKDWEIVVFKDESANAFALPGGKIGVHTGILKVAKTPGQLAAVLGHEVGHVIARHGNERVSQGTAAQLLMAGGALATQSSANQGLIMAAIGAGAQYGVLLPFSRKHESEADEIGIFLAAKAGFDPAEAVELWKNMGAAGGKQPPQWMSTHPSHETRIKDLQAKQSKARPDYEKAIASGKRPNCSL